MMKEFLFGKPKFDLGSHEKRNLIFLQIEAMDKIMFALFFTGFLALILDSLNEIEQSVALSLRLISWALFAR